MISDKCCSSSGAKELVHKGLSISFLDILWIRQDLQTGWWVDLHTSLARGLIFDRFHIGWSQHDHKNDQFTCVCPWAIQLISSGTFLLTTLQYLYTNTIHALKTWGNNPLVFHSPPVDPDPRQIRGLPLEQIVIFVRWEPMEPEHRRRFRRGMGPHGFVGYDECPQILGL